jgi:hypothetical protein
MGRRREGVANVHLMLPAKLFEECRRRASARGLPLTRWVEEAMREKLERERARELFDLLPRPVRDKLLGATGGDEVQAARLFDEILEKALEGLGKPAGGNQPPEPRLGAPIHRVAPLLDTLDDEDGEEGDWPSEEDEEAFQEAVAAAGRRGRA